MHLTSVVLPDSLTKIGKGAFEDCTSLTSMVSYYLVLGSGSQLALALITPQSFSFYYTSATFREIHHPHNNKKKEGVFQKSPPQ